MSYDDPKTAPLEPNGAAGAQGAEPARHVQARARVATRLETATVPELAELYRFWADPDAPPPPSSPTEVRRQIAAWMSDGACIEARLGVLGRRATRVIGPFLEAPNYARTAADLRADKSLTGLSSFEIDSALELLKQHALVAPAPERRTRASEGPNFALPVELGDALLRQQRAKRRGVFDLLTLRGFLDRQYDDPSRSRRTSPTRLREMYKMYSNEAAAVARIERLPDDIRPLVEKCVIQFGGLLPRALFERMEIDQPNWNGARWKSVLEGSLVGTVERLELTRYGLHHGDETLLVFNEVAVAWLRRVAVPGDPERPHEEHSLGVDLVSNISRFMGYLLEHSVRFTVRGEIFKTTEKRIQEELIPNPGRELTRAAVLDFIFEFTRSFGLIESTGERTFAMTGEGRAWEQRTLEQKLELLVEYVVDERDVAGDWRHHSHLRRIFMRLLKRVEPLVWYDLMYLPFLSRNTYLASLDQLGVEQAIAARGGASGYAPLEDPQRLAWNMARWVRQRLYLLGLVDLGYDKTGRPVAMRLTRVGAKLLGTADGSPHSPPMLGSLIVTPDFEVVLFPTGDDAELVHELDRFCVREKQGETLHFRIHEKSVQRALSEGMHLSRILSTLRNQSRTPTPQNVLYSLRDWSNRAGLLILDAKLVMRGEDPDTLRRFQQDAGVKNFVREVLDERRLQLKSRYAPRRLATLLREFGYLVELEGAAS